MNSALFFAGFLAVIGIAVSLTCTDGNHKECEHLKCVPDDDYQRACINGTCTCIVSVCHEALCSGAHHNCDQTAGGQGCTCNEKWHCLDGKCACGFNVIGK